MSKQARANSVFKILSPRSNKSISSSIDWLWLSSNPNAIQLLEKRVVYQLSLHGDQLEGLSINKRINWQKISSNPAIFVPQ